jgi:hypothetical protein
MVSITNAEFGKSEILMAVFHYFLPTQEINKFLNDNNYKNTSIFTISGNNSNNDPLNQNI